MLLQNLYIQFQYFQNYPAFLIHIIFFLQSLFFLVKKFVLPGCIADKFLEVEDESIFEYFTKSNEIHKKRMNTELKIKSASFAIQRHEGAIEKLNAKLK